MHTLLFLVPQLAVASLFVCAQSIWNMSGGAGWLDRLDQIEEGSGNDALEEWIAMLLSMGPWEPLVAQHNRWSIALGEPGTGQDDEAEHLAGAVL